MPTTLGSINLRCGLVRSINPSITDHICYQYFGNFIIELFLEFRSSLQHCSGSASKNRLGGQQNYLIHFLWETVVSLARPFTHPQGKERGQVLARRFILTFPTNRREACIAYGYGVLFVYIRSSFYFAHAWSLRLPTYYHW